MKQTLSLLAVVALFAACAAEPTPTTEPTPRDVLPTLPLLDDSSNRQIIKVRLIAPLQDWVVTDYALSFTWKRENLSTLTIPLELPTDYQVQVSNESSFIQPAIDIVHLAPGEDETRFEPGDDLDPEHQEIVESLKGWAECVFTPDIELAPGRWFWRVRVSDASETWSDPVSFVVSGDWSTQPLIRELSSSHPLFTFDLYDSDGGGFGESPPWHTYWDFFPADLQPYVALAVPHEGWGDESSPAGTAGPALLTFEQFIQPLAEQSIPMLIKTGGPDCDYQCYLSTTELEHIYQNSPNVLGVVTGENTWAYIDGYSNPSFRRLEVEWLRDLISLSSQYGRYVILGEGAYDFAWDKFLGLEIPNQRHQEGDYEWLSPDFIKEHKATIIPSPKSNINWSWHQGDSAVFGARLAGLVDHQGIWAEAWYWGDSGFSEGVFADQIEANENFESMPTSFWLQTMLMGVAKGTVAYHFGGESSVTDNRGTYDLERDAFVDEDSDTIWDDGSFGEQYTTFWDMSGNKTAGFDRYILPFIRAVVNQELIPSNAEVRSEVKIAIDPGPVEGDKGNFVCYGHYAELYKATYGIREFIDSADMEDGDLSSLVTGCRYELIPNTGRYFFIPVIPHPVDDYPLDNIEIVSIHDLQNTDEILSIFNVRYPDRFEGEAWLTQVGNRFFVTNSHENKNHLEAFGMSLDTGYLSKITGVIQPHSFLLGSLSDDGNSVYIHANGEIGSEYSDTRSTLIEMHWLSKPIVSVTPSSALDASNWDGEILSLTLSHAGGAVDVIVRVD